MHIALKSALAAATAIISIAASAQPFARIDTRDIDARQAHQEQRIERGLTHGALTRREARMLQQGQREIARVEARAKTDGRISRDEMRNLTALLDRADAQIRQLSHDRDAHRRT
jgi:hypothetical protein